MAKQKFEIEQKHIAIGGGVLLLLVVLFFIGKNAGVKQREERNIDVKATLTDTQGNTTQYDPTDLLRRLNKGLTTTYFFDTSERCDPMKELLALDALRFVAAIKGYKTKYGRDIQTDMDACYYSCNVRTGSKETYFQKVKQRIASMQSLIA